jgi:micrococcal nuclease
MTRVLFLALVLITIVGCSDEYGSGPTGSATATRMPSQSGSQAPATTDLTLPEGATQAVVTRVVDGDTIRVEIQGVEYRVRYIGIDTPETVDPRRPVGCFGPEASAFNESLVGGRNVGLEKDVSETDSFGRLLRYVWLPAEETESGEPEMVNALLLEHGYAQIATFPPDVKYQGEFLTIQQEARESQRGLWGAACDTDS